jgi:hypothetical protein
MSGVEVEMARGFESKSVESQQADREAPREKPQPVTPEEARRLARRQILGLSRARALADLQRACNPAHRAMLEAAIQALDAQINENE